MWAVHFASMIYIAASCLEPGRGRILEGGPREVGKERQYCWRNQVSVADTGISMCAVDSTYNG